MRRPEPHIGNHPGVRSGVFYLLLILALLQGLKWGITRGFPREGRAGGLRVDSVLQAGLDTIRRQHRPAGGWTLRPLDPNRLEDYRGYLLGIPPGALDSLYAFRSRGGVLYRMEQFQQITGLSDSVCKRLSPYFNFPRLPPASGQELKKASPRGKDLNRVTARELRTVPGIGPVFSERIVRFREALGGFLHPHQLYDVYGLEPEVARRVMDSFPLRSVPPLTKLDVNSASAEELASLAYLTYPMAAALVALRDSLGPFKNAEELRAVPGLPRDKIERIALYLQF